MNTNGFGTDGSLSVYTHEVNAPLRVGYRRAGETHGILFCVYVLFLCMHTNTVFWRGFLPRGL